MLIPRTPLPAYLLDTAELQSDATSDTWLSGCLAYAMALDHATSVVAAVEAAGVEAHLGTSSSEVAIEREYERLSAIADEYALVARTAAVTREGASASICALTRAVASETEVRGALHSSYSLLSMLDRLSHKRTPLEYGRILAHRARIARKANSPAVAEELYRRVYAIAKDVSSDELRARALIGQGILAHAKGNYPAARRYFIRAARSANKTGESSLIRHAYHGLMVVAAKYGKLGQAFKAGWLAFRGAAGDRELEADMLINLGQLAFDAGEPRAALHSFAAALSRDPAPWRRLPALGGAARAAAALGERKLLQVCASRIDCFDAASSSFAYERAAALWDLARACMIANLQAEAVAFATRAHTLAATHGFHELVLESERLIADTTHAPNTAKRARETATIDPRPTIDSGGHTVLRRLTSLARPDRVLVQL